MPTKSIKKITAYLFLLRLFRMSVSMVTLLFSAKYFGISMQRDLWVLVITLITAVSGGLFGPINETFRAKFIFIKEQEGESKAISATFSLITWMTIIIILVGVIMAITRTYIGIALYPEEVSQKSIDVFNVLLMIMIPILLLNQWTNIGISILNAFEIYYIPEIVGSITCLTNVGMIILLAPSIGIFSLAVSTYFSTLLLLGVTIYYLCKIVFFKRDKIGKISFKGFWTFLIFASPFYFPYFVGQCNSLVEKWLSGLLGQGLISSLEYARQFTTVIQGVLSGILSTLMLPLLSKAYIRKEKFEHAKIFNDNLSSCFAILSITITVLFGAAEPLCQFFFNRGSIGENSLSIITNLMQSYAISFIGVALYIIMGNTMLASNQGKKYAIIGVLVQITVILTNISLVKILGIYIFPISLGITHLVGAIIMFYFIKFDHPYEILKKIIKYIFVIFIIGCSLLCFNYYVGLNSSFLTLTINLPVLGFLVLIFARHLDIDAVKLIRKFIH